MLIHYKRKIDYSNIPRHVAIIMDGNGRWAKRRGLPRIEGHRRGAETIERCMDTAIELGINVVSLYAFSTENWSRPKEEINGLWNLLESFFEKKLNTIIEKGVQVRHSGSLKELPVNVQRIITDAVEKSKNNSRIILNFCLNYGGRHEIIHAVNEWLQKKPSQELSLTPEIFESYLYTRGLPDVDLLIRTSGEYRISNFLLWQIAYAELVFMKVLWPDFNEKHLYQAIYEYQHRERRFGGL
ncbi:MAG: isoprenyl transferase [Spirochaetota bacterium]|nr:isoprenyl transferase [Spirochaetota bacterium]